MTVLVLAWMAAAMLAAILVTSAALGMYDGLLVAELAALAVLAISAVAWRRASPDAGMQRRHRERRGF